MISVTFFNSKFCSLISNFAKWFPKARSLCLDKQPRLELKKRLMLENRVPALKRFSIENTDNKRHLSKQNERKLNNYNISTFIKLNPQLESLSIFCDMKIKLHFSPSMNYCMILMALKWTRNCLELLKPNYQI